MEYDNKPLDVSDPLYNEDGDQLEQKRKRHQGGNDTDNVIADCYLKNVPLRKYTWDDAYKVLIASAEKMRSKEYNENGVATSNAKTVSGCEYSYRFKPAAVTMGFAVNSGRMAGEAIADYING